jgi:hypothetical protein
MKEDLKTKLFANVLLGANEEPPAFKLPRRSTLSLQGVVAVTLAALSLAGLLFLVFEKIKPLL